MAGTRKRNNAHKSPAGGSKQRKKLGGIGTQNFTGKKSAETHGEQKKGERKKGINSQRIREFGGTNWAGKGDQRGLFTKKRERPGNGQHVLALPT